MAIVDERHKLAIYQALLQVGEIHAVCFVVKENYGGDFQKAVREFIYVFNLTLPNAAEEISYYVVRTKFSPKDRFSEELRIRERDFNKFTRVWACHHFVDNFPRSMGPIECYFAKCALAGLVEDLAGEPGVVINTVVNSGGAKHCFNDNQLDRVMREVATSYTKDLELPQNHLSLLKREKSNANRDYENLNEPLQKILLNICRQDTDEDVEVNHSTCTAVPNWPWPRGVAEIPPVTSKTIISDWKVTDHQEGSFGETIKNTIEESPERSPCT